MSKHVLDAGTYFVGDPCTILSSKDYDKIVLSTDDDFITGEFFAIHHVSGGDGLYKDGNYRQFPVDSGMFGLMLTELGDINGDLTGLHKIKSYKRLIVDADGDSFKVTEEGTNRVLFSIFFDFEDEDDIEEIDDEEDIGYDFDENDFESNQDCSDRTPDWY